MRTTHLQSTVHGSIFFRSRLHAKISMAAVSVHAVYQDRCLGAQPSPRILSPCTDKNYHCIIQGKALFLGWDELGFRVHRTHVVNRKVRPKILKFVYVVFAQVF